MLRAIHLFFYGWALSPDFHLEVIPQKSLCVFTLFVQLGNNSEWLVPGIGISWQPFVSGFSLYLLVQGVRWFSIPTTDSELCPWSRVLRERKNGLSNYLFFVLPLTFIHWLLCCLTSEAQDPPSLNGNDNFSFWRFFKRLKPDTTMGWLFFFF